jgi:hypothetical protein
MSIRPLILSLLLLASAWPALADDVYQVELLLFQGSGDSRGEVLESAWDENAPARPQPVNRLQALAAPPASWRLGPQAYTLERRGHPVLYRLAWRQTPGSRSSERWYSFDAAGVQGLVRLTRGRFLHIDVDLVLADGERVVMRRRMRSDELHYLDHPRVGMLVRADPYEPAGAAPEADSVAPTPPAATDPTGQENSGN